MENMQYIRESANKEGEMAVQSYIRNIFDRFKTEQVVIGVTGGYATGKLTFINAIRGLKPEDPDFALPPRVLNITRMPRVYIHPKNKNISFCRLPGINSFFNRKEKYAELMKFYKYDFFVILFRDFIREDDLYVAREIIKLKKPFCFIRSQMDIDLDSCMFDGFTEEEKMQEIKEKAESLLKNDKDLASSSKIFYISYRKPKIEEICSVVDYIEKRLSEVKQEASHQNTSLQNCEVS